jgi:hypothetical protein
MSSLPSYLLGRFYLVVSLRVVVPRTEAWSERNSVCARNSKSEISKVNLHCHTHQLEFRITEWAGDLDSLKFEVSIVLVLRRDDSHKVRKWRSPL